jgi:DNA polymerase II small subunit/DNA polymerase delta subunit B
MTIKEYNEDGSVSTEFNGSQYEYERWLERREKEKESSFTTTVKRPKVVIQENVEKVTKYDVKNVVFSKADVKEAFKNDPEKLQEILKHKLEEGGISKMDYDIPITEIKEIFKKNPEKLQEILEADICNYGRFYTKFTEKDIKDIFRDDPSRLQKAIETINETRRLEAETENMRVASSKLIVKGFSIGIGVGLASIGIGYTIYNLVKKDVIPSPKEAWLKGKNS